MAVVLRQLVTNLMPSVSGGAYQDARKVSLVWNDIQNIDACLNSEAERTKRVQAPLFSPIFSGKTEKIGPPEARQK